MSETLKLAITALVSFTTGGAMGSLLTEWFRRRRGRTRAIPLIERVNRNPVATELKGIQLFRVPSQAGEVPTGIKNIREYQLTLRNSSDKDLRGAEIQFEFSSSDVEPWASRPAVSNAALQRAAGAPSEPWKKAVRWLIPQFPPGDSVEFSFQVVDPETDKYEAVLYNVDNAVLKRTRGEPTEGSDLLIKTHDTILYMLLGILGAAATLSGHYLFGHLGQVAPTALRSADETQIEQTITESQKLKYTGVFRDPKGFDRSRLSAYWVSAAQGGEAMDRIIGAAERLAKYDLNYGPESKSDRFQVYQVNLLSPEFARASTAETWYLTTYWNGTRVQGCTPNFDGGATYTLRKIEGRWLIQSEHGLIDGPDECAIRGQGARAK
jgi:hypothetical protein